MSTAQARARGGGFRVLVAAIVVWSLFPFLWQLVASVQPDWVLGAATPSLLPTQATVEHYTNIFTVKGFGQFLANSVIVAVSATVIALVFAVFAGYALARLPLPGKRLSLVVKIGRASCRER